MTFEDDFIKLDTFGGPKLLRCLPNNIAWPPPEKLELLGFKWKRVSMSAITDAQREKMTHVMRGALYQAEGNT